MTRRGVTVDDRLRAGDGVWAIGDAAGVGLLTHLGKYQARVAAANIAGRDVRADYRAIPAAVFTDPQVASVGEMEGEHVVTARFDIDGGRLSTYERPKRPGFVKLAADREQRVLVGAIAVGPEAGEWLGQLTLAIRAEVPLDVLLDTIQPYPTFSEAIFSALQELDDRLGELSGMPEGDSLHRIARRLQVLVGERVEAESPNPRGQATGVARAVDGRVLERVEAVGKNLLLRFEGGVVVRSHLRMNGRWRVRRRGRRARGEGRRGSCCAVASGRRRSGTGRCSHRASAVGSRARARISSRRRRSRTSSSPGSAGATRHGSWARRSSTSGSSPGSGTCGSPRRSGTRASRRGRRSRSVSDDELQRHARVGAQMRCARPSAAIGRARAVYRRAGRGCPRCGHAVRSRGLGDANRTAYWCPACQPTRRQRRGRDSNPRRADYHP